MAGSSRSPEPTGAADQVPAISIDRVVAGYDGSDESAAAVRWAAEIARLSSAALRVVWVWRMRDVWDDALAAQHGVEIPPVPELEEVARGRLVAAVDDLVGQAVPQVDIYLDRGPDPTSILVEAAADADVLVLGSRGRGRLASALVGSVSARCIREATCPVLVLPHDMVVPPANHIDPASPQAQVLARRAESRG